jgi:hypothetical protein
VHLAPGEDPVSRSGSQRTDPFQADQPNFPSVVELDVFDCPELKMISGLSCLHKIRIVRCLKLEALEGVPALVSIEMEDGTMETLPEYLRGVNPRFLNLYCSQIWNCVFTCYNLTCKGTR